MERLDKMEKPRIALIAAIGERTRALGFDGGLLFEIPEDMKRFKNLTLGHVVIMGRKTWESIPAKFRPLPGRQNIVITRNAATYDAPDALVCDSFEHALETAKGLIGVQKIFIIGGAQVYQEALPFADTLFLTLVDDDTEGDVFFPEYSDFTKKTEDEAHDNGSYKFRYVTLTR